MTKKSIEFYQEAYLEFKQIDTGQSCRKLGEILGVDRTTISGWRRGRTPESKYGPVDEATLKQAEYMLEEGYPYTVVARVVSVDPHTLRYHFPGKGWKSGPFKRPDYDLEDYVEH